MTNLPYPKARRVLPHIKQQHGYIFLLMTAVILFMMGIMSYIGAQSALTQQKTATTNYSDQAAYEAAEAGLQFGVGYLQTNYPTIVVDANNNGFIDTYSNSSVTNASLTTASGGNGSTFSVGYTNPIQNNFSAILVSSVGTSPDGLVQRKVSEIVTGVGYMANDPPAPVVVLGAVSLSGNSNIVNTASNTSIWSGSTVSLSGSASTQGAAASSSKSSINSDVVQSDPSLSSQTPASLFNLFFNQTTAAAQAAATVSYTNSGSTNYSSSLSGLTNQIIWINQTGGTATINGNTTIGTAAQPVILVVNGNLSINGNVTINGAVYVANDWNNGGGGNAAINGALIVAGAFSSTGAPDVNYSTAIINALPNVALAWIPGSWKDF